MGWIEGRGWVGPDYWTQRLQEGHSLGTFYLPEFVRLYNGEFIYVSNAGGLTNNWADAPRKVAGSAMPKFEIGWSNYVTYKNFDVGMSVRAVIGHSVYNGPEMMFGNPIALLNGQNVTYGAIDLYNKGVEAATAFPSTYFLEKASFLRFDAITLGYTLPIRPNNYIRTCRVSFTGSNLLTLTGYKGLDPEVTYNYRNGGDFSFGVDNYSVYPRVRSYMLGLSAQF
jgi:iron complex outermembrane receptor protein